MLEIVERRAMRTYAQILQLLQLVNFLIAVSRIVSGGAMKIIAFLLISIQKSLTIETVPNFPKANVLLTVRYELPVASHYCTIAMRFSVGMAFRKMISFFLKLRETKSSNFRNLKSLIGQSFCYLF